MQNLCTYAKLWLGLTKVLVGKVSFFFSGLLHVDSKKKGEKGRKFSVYGLLMHGRTRPLLRSADHSGNE